MTTTTEGTTREVVTAQLKQEQERHESVSAAVAALAKHEGKKFTRRLLPALQEATGEELFFSDEYGLQQLTCRSYYRSDGNSGWRMLLGHGTGSPVIDTDKIRGFNTAYLEAAEKRNQQRQDLLATDWPERVDAAAIALMEARKTYAELTGYATCPDSFHLERAHGLKKA